MWAYFFWSKLRGRGGVEILLVITDWTSAGGGGSCMQIVFTRGGVVGLPEGDGESSMQIVFTHDGEEKIWRFVKNDIIN
jgi:hypothetical protein